MSEPDVAGPATFAQRAEFDVAVEQLAAAAAAYYAGDGSILMADADYDVLEARLRATEAANPEWHSGRTDQVAAGAAVGDVPHSAPMLSLAKATTEVEVRSWFERLVELTGDPEPIVIVEPKLDGVAIAARYVQGKRTLVLTRGGGQAGEDVSAQFADNVVGLPTSVDADVSFEVRGECFMTAEQFAQANALRIDTDHKPAFVNARNATAGSVRAIHRKYLTPMTFAPYTLLGGDAPDDSHSGQMNWLAGLGFAPAGTRVDVDGRCQSVDDVLVAIAAIGKLRASLDFDIDGAVAKADAQADRDAAGATGAHPRWAIAFKYPAEERTTTLLAIDITPGRTGALVPRATLEPVFVAGATVSYATLHNPEEVMRLDVRIGDTVLIKRAGDVIPRIEGVVLAKRPKDAKPWVAPEVCPRCGSPIDRSQKRWRCTRGRACGAPELLVYAASRDALDIEGLGEVLVAQLVDARLALDVADLYDLDVEQVAGLEHMGQLSAEKVIANIAAAKTKPLDRQLIALGIRMTGRRLCRRIARHFGTLQAVRAATVEELADVEGIGEVRAAIIIDELSELSELLDRLVAAGIETRDEHFGEAAPSPDGLPLAGMTVVVSGAMSGPFEGRNRNAMNELIEANGGRSAGSVSSKTTYLVTNETGTSKAVKAEQLGVPVLTPEAFAQLIDNAD